MIKYDTFIARLRENRCIKNNFILTSNESIISEKSFPYLYQNKFNEEEKNYIKYILSFIHKYNRDILNLEKEELNKIQKLYNLLIMTNENITKEKKYISEREIHLYIFLFWENLIWDTTTIINLKKENFFYEGQKINSNNNPKFQDNLLPHISNNCDLIYYNHENNTIELIEIKNVDLDDRAISQIQRYYRNTNLVCETYQHNLKIVNLKPTLIIRHKNIINDKKNQTTLLQYWLTFPTYFRELLQIYSFSYCKDNETLKLIDLKPKLKALIKKGEK